MAKVYVAEFDKVAVAQHPMLAGDCPPLNGQEIEITGSLVPVSDPFKGDTRMIRVFSEADCFVVIGEDTAAADAVRLPMAANQTEYFGAKHPMKIAAIQR